MQLEEGFEELALQVEGHLEGHQLSEIVDHYETTHDGICCVELTADDLHQQLPLARDVAGDCHLARRLVGKYAHATLVNKHTNRALAALVREVAQQADLHA